MDSKANEHLEDPAVSETPEDVAILYSWANLHGAKYRDFSASRREYRAKLRHQAAEKIRELELKAQAEAEAAAALAESAAREAARAANQHLAEQDKISHEEALRAAEESARRAAAERVEAARRAEAAATAEVAARREEREMAEAHASAQRQAARYNETEQRRRQLAGPQPMSMVPGQVTDPYMPASGGDSDADASSAGMEHLQLGRYRQTRDRNDPSIAPGPNPQRPGEEIPRAPDEVRFLTQADRQEEIAGYRPANRPATPPTPISYITTMQHEPAGPPQVSGPPPQAIRSSSDAPTGPAWLYAPHATTSVQPAGRTWTPIAPVSSIVADTLQHSRERVASRWFALKGVFDQPNTDFVEAQSARQPESGIPLLAVFSLAGGVGKTSLVATLGRALSSQGERVILADTTSHGLLPFYFGATELRPGVVRTFSPPSGQNESPISLISYDLEHFALDPVQQDQFFDDFIQKTRGSNRILLDLSGSAGWIIRRVAGMNPTVLIPVAPDMNSVISLQGVEKTFHGIMDVEGRAVEPYYLLNGFDASLPLHLDVREVLRRQLGARLLPFVVRRAPAVSEALAEGMTVVDYAPDAPVADDYITVANWLHKLSAPASSGFRNVRWSER